MSKLKILAEELKIALNLRTILALLIIIPFVLNGKSKRRNQ